jgi:hypothetical protein
MPTGGRAVCRLEMLQKKSQPEENLGWFFRMKGTAVSQETTA